MCIFEVRLEILGVNFTEMIFGVIVERGTNGKE